MKPATTEDLETAFDRIKSYVEPHRRRLLVVEDNDIERQGIVELVAHDDIDVAAVPTGREALSSLRSAKYDCCVVDLRLPDMSGFDVLERLREEEALSDVPVVVFTGRELSPEEDARLHTMARSIVVKGVESPERLLDETALFLHRVEKKLPEQKRRMLERLHNSDAVFSGKRVLIVDDDVRNIFSLTSVLEDHGMVVDFVENGKDALTKLDRQPDYDIVLMDIMMPDMDGYETIQAIRKLPKFRSLPIVALTAKAMKGDREKCLEAGASDYLAKPVNTEQLLSVLRVWLHR